MNQILHNPIAIACCLLAALVSVVHANNNSFLPGDAFFSTSLTAVDTARFKADPGSPPVFTYRAFDGDGGTFCGFAGYENARIPCVDEAFLANLRRAYKSIRSYEARQLVERTENGKTTLVETNPVRVFFYPQSFDFPRFTIGLQYNENWVEETAKFGHRPEVVRIGYMVDDPNAIADAWRDAAIIPPLDVTLPDVAPKKMASIKEPITVRGDVKAIVVDSTPLADYYNAFIGDHFSLLIVDSSGITKMVYEELDWTAEPFVD